MKKIVIVGHPQSGYQDVEALLNACGMTAARPSRREGFSPVEIGSILTRSHAIPATGQLDDSQAIEQIEPSPVWHGMALDLMLGNLDQDVWGWADPQAISLLNYWRDLDPQITFMLVYDKPHSVLTRLGAGEAVNLTADNLRERVGNWAAYNAALLHFFHRNSQRCLLVHSEQVRESVGTYLQQVRARIDAPWSERMEQLLTLGSADGASSSDGTMDIAFLAGGINGARLNTLEVFAATEKEPKRAPVENALVLFLADTLIQQNPAGLQLYEELQAVANLPLAIDGHVTHDPMQAWLAMAGQEQRLNDADTLLREKESLIGRLAQSQAAAEQIARERERMIGQQARAHEALQKAQQDSSQESELLLAQLHQVQEELERHHVSSQQQEQKVQALMQSEKLSAEKNKQLDEARMHAAKHAKELGEQLEQIKRQLAVKNTEAESAAARFQTELHARQHRVTELEKAQQDTLQENELLLTQLHKVQEELERHYMERQQQEKKVQALMHGEKLITQKNKELTEAQARAAKQASELGEQLDKIRKQFAAENEQAKKEAALLKAKLQAAETKATIPAPVIANNNSALEQENEHLLAQLHQVQEELERFYLENQKLKVEMAKMPKPEPMRYGAANLVRQQLPYRLGATLVQRSRSLTGWLGMPAALAREARQFRRENPLGANAASLPVESYADAHEAIKVKQHLSYRLGVTLVANSDSPVGWVKLPWVLLREVRQYRTQRKTSAGAYNAYQNRTSAPTR